MWPLLYNSSSIVVPTYIVLISLAFSLGVVWVYWRSSRRKNVDPIEPNHVLDVAMAVMIGAFVGARVFHVLFEHPSFYLENPSFVLKFWHGGFVYYGGALGGFAAGLWICRRRGYDFWAMGDLFVPVLAGGYALGRLGCLAAGCCFGSPTTMPWGISFPDGCEAPPGISLHPTQIYSSLWEASLMVFLLFLEKRHPTLLKARGKIFGLWIAFHGLGRALIEQFRGDFRGPNLFNLSISTWISGLAMIYGIYIVAKARGSKEEIVHHASTAV